MKITRFESKEVNKNVLKSLECEECRCKITTDDLYTIGFSLNKNNGKSLLLCGKCVRDLQESLNQIVK